MLSNKFRENPESRRLAESFIEPELVTGMYGPLQNFKG